MSACNTKTLSFLFCFFLRLRLHITQKRLIITIAFYFFFFSTVNLDGLPKVVLVSIFYGSSRYMWPLWDLLNNHVYVLEFRMWKHDMSCASQINSNGSFKRENAALQRLNSLYLYCQNVDGHQTWLDVDLPCEVPSHKVTWPFDHLV